MCAAARRGDTSCTQSDRCELNLGTVAATAGAYGQLTRTQQVAVARCGGGVLRVLRAVALRLVSSHCPAERVPTVHRIAMLEQCTSPMKQLTRTRTFQICMRK